MAIRSFAFGELDGVAVPAFELSNGAGMRAKVVGYGARLTEMHVPDRHGRFADVVLGFDDLASYLRHETYFGATCGRFGNRIAKGRFGLDGITHQLDCNENGAHHLHGGVVGFDRKLWSAAVDESRNAVLFSLTSPDGEEGYPGTLAASVCYRLTEAGELKVRMTAASDRPTVANLVHHSYWNLAGHAAGPVDQHCLTIAAEHYLPVDAQLIPTGEVAAVAGTPFDFRHGATIGSGLAALGGDGFDHNWCLTGAAGWIRPVIRLVEPGSGRGFEIETNQPGVQFYAGGQIPSDGPQGKGGARYGRFGGLALETQLPPNAPNIGHFASARLTPGTLYDHQMIIRFFSE